jgi:acetolactate synthase I/II/III large subunit
MITGSELIVKFIERKGISECYMVTGGGAMFLNDAFGKSKKIKKVFNLHEQACAMAALGSSKLTNKPTVVVPTTGCGGTNTITGLLDAWQDSNPVIFISGNVKQSECTFTDSNKLRKKGVQEANIVEIVKSITKHSTFTRNLNELFDALIIGYHEMITGRPGPVWIDVPMDIQSMRVPKDIENEFWNRVDIEEPTNSSQIDYDKLSQCQDLISTAKKPIVVAGYGIHLSNQIENFNNFIQQNKLPFVTTYLGIDYTETANEYFIGRLGTKGDRSGNFVINQSDLVIILGSSVNITVTGFQFEHFAPKAKIIWIDIDEFEDKKGNCSPDVKINTCLSEFFKTNQFHFNFPTRWLEICREWKSNWPTFLNEYYNTENGVNMYLALEMIYQSRENETIYVSDAGSAYYVTSQSLKLEKGDRYITSGAQADMGFTLPAAIGACIASGGEKNIIAITGDGSLQMNIQELSLMKGENLNIKLAVLNNKGYLSIRNSQERFFESRYVGIDEGSGLFLPDLQKIAKAYDIPYIKISTYSDQKTLKKLINTPGPLIIDFDCPKSQQIIPTSSTKKLEDGTLISPPLDDMLPFLSKEELIYNREKSNLK